jgi:phosphatidylserine synthase
MVDAEERQEKGASLMFIGVAVWVAAFLVLFFLPAGFRLGHQGGFEALLVALFVTGVVLLGSGWRMRRAK